jgi:hypothetical protein
MHRYDPHAMKLEDTRREVTEAPRRVPVRVDSDVLVIGGGPAGVGAALAAARSGAKVLLLERYNLLGGMWTAGLVNPFFEADRNGWLIAELIGRLKEAGAWTRWLFAYTFDPERMKVELETMMLEAGVEVLYGVLGVDAIVQEGQVLGAVVESKAGREACLARVTIDCTGDGDIAARAGAPFELGRPSDGLVQPMTLMFELEGLSPDFVLERATDLYDAMVRATEEAGLDYELPVGRVGYAPWVITLPDPRRAAVQLTHVYRLNPLCPVDLTRGIIDGRRQALAAAEVLKHVPGLEGARLGQTAGQIGIRESRRICGEYTLTLEDLVTGRRFEDAIAACGFGVDIHEPAPGSGVPSGHGARMQPYEIPYRCLLPQELTGLLVAGRCLSGTHEAHASYRVTGTCMATGQAAGLAAALAVSEGMLPHELAGARVRAGLQERGVRLLDG